MKFAPKTKGGKIFWGIGLLAVALFLFLISWDSYSQWRSQKRVEELANELERIEREAFEKRAADKIGGKTPQETLDLFIAAVEKGDYELASRYFVVEKQGEWRKELSELENDKKLNIFLEPVLEAKNIDGEYSLTKNSYSIHRPVLISFILYPSGNWKIEKI